MQLTKLNKTPASRQVCGLVLMGAVYKQLLFSSLFYSFKATLLMLIQKSPKKLQLQAEPNYQLLNLTFLCIFSLPLDIL